MRINVILPSCLILLTLVLVDGLTIFQATSNKALESQCPTEEPGKAEFKFKNKIKSGKLIQRANCGKDRQGVLIDVYSSKNPSKVLYTACVDKKRKTTYYVDARIGNKVSKSGDHKSKDWNNVCFDSDMDLIYRTSIPRPNPKLVGDDNSNLNKSILLDNNIAFVRRDSTFDKGHLLPKVDVELEDGGLTFLYINAVPQWPDLNQRKNWVRLEEIVRYEGRNLNSKIRDPMAEGTFTEQNLAPVIERKNKYNKTSNRNSLGNSQSAETENIKTIPGKVYYDCRSGLRVVSGTWGILQWGENTMRNDWYLGESKTPKIVPVPRYLWKLIWHPLNPTCPTAIVHYNNPYMKDNEPIMLPEPPCEETACPEWFEKNESRMENSKKDQKKFGKNFDNFKTPSWGYTYCCKNAEHFMDNVGVKEFKSGSASKEPSRDKCKSRKRRVSKSSEYTG